MPRLRESARRERLEQRREQILRAAVKVFGRKGYERATIADIAREARLAEGSIYNYFKNKGDLLVQIPHLMMQPTVENLSDQLSRWAAGGELPPPEVVLPMIARTMIATMRQNAQFFRILLTGLPALNRSAREEYMQDVVAYGSGAVEAYLREELKRGALDSRLEPHVAALNFIGLFFPFIMLRDVLQIPDSKSVEYEQVIAQSVRTFLRGVLPSRGEGESH